MIKIMRYISGFCIFESSEIFTFLSFSKTYFINGPLEKLIPGVVLFGAPEWLAPYSNIAALATLAPWPCHLGTRASVEGVTWQMGAPATLAPPLIPWRQSPWRTPPRGPSSNLLPQAGGWRHTPQAQRQVGWRRPPPPTPEDFCLGRIAGAAPRSMAPACLAPLPQPVDLLPWAGGWRCPL